MKMSTGMGYFVIVSGFILIFIQFGVVVSDKGKPLVDLYRSCHHNLFKSLGGRSQKCTAKTDEFLAGYGYATENHRVETKDGYILSVYRANQRNATFPNKKVVIVHHGVLSSSDDIVISSPEQGLVYTLADRGYDVWLMNSRGNYYSRLHLNYDPDKNSDEFWNFSWDDIALYDYTAVYEYVRRKTGVQKFFVIGHSRGVTALVALLSDKPEYNDYMYAAGLLAPPVYFEHATRLQRIVKAAWNFLRKRKNTELLARPFARSCSSNHICRAIITMTVGHEAGKDKDNVPIFLCHFPSGTSTNEFIHYAHMVKYKYFGPKMYKYEGEIPEEYQVDRITVPMSIHYSAVDHFTPELDVQKLINNLINVKDKEVNFIPESEKFEHGDFVIGTKAKRLVYDNLLNFFDKYAKANGL